MIKYSRSIKRCFPLGRKYFGTNRAQIAASDKVAEEIKRIRNIGIIAHIDAGKTTTTERILYLVGETRHQGNVDAGDTVTDYMSQERERGITIQSAAVSLNWNGCHINLIDTPGHVDFSMEVERSIRILDGTILVLDAVAGVQAQTETVWRTAHENKVPAIAFLNKFDRRDANLETAVLSMSTKLGINAIPLQVPLQNDDGFIGFIDLLSMDAIIYSPQNLTDLSDLTKVLQLVAEKNPETADSMQMKRVELDTVTAVFPDVIEEADRQRKIMLERIAESDEEFMDNYLSNGEGNGIYSIQDILSSIRRMCISRQGVPVLCGASLKGIGVEPLLDSVVAFLPSPLDRDAPKGYTYPKQRGKKAKAQKRKGKLDGRGRVIADRISSEVDPTSGSLVALAFKVLHDKRMEPLVFLRVYSGELNSRAVVRNSNKNVTERCHQLLQIHANEYKSVTSVKAGQVAAVVGYKQTFTGDTITDTGEYESMELEGVHVPQPVFSLSVEPERSDQQESLDKVLQIICREDPSIKVETDKDTGQRVLRGIGELHLEIVCERLRSEFDIPVQTGRVFIAYHEAVTNDIEVSEDFDRELIPGKRMYAGLDLSLTRLEDSNASCEVELSDEVSDVLSAQEMEELMDSLLDASSRGPVGGYPMVGMQITVTAVRRDANTSAGALRFAANSILLDASRRAEAVLMEPVMNCEIAVPPSHLGTVLNDLSSHRRAHIRNINTGIGDETENRALSRYVLHASVPLRELVGYASSLRALSAAGGDLECTSRTQQLILYAFKGEASFTMELEGYQPMESFVAEQVIRDGY